VNLIEDNFRGSVLPVVEPRFEQSLLLLLVFVGVIALNLLADRFWCRYLCPLGALLGLVAKVQVLRPLVGDACTHCGPCAASCRMGAIDVPPTEGEPRSPAPGGTRLTTSECTMCLDCLVACPGEGVMGIGIERRPQLWREYGPGRRSLLAAGAGGLAAGALLAFGVRRAEAGPRLLRPPGALDEPDFLSSCLRCTECIKACPTSGLQPALGQAGLEGFWTPVLVPRIGQCDYGCTACGEVCPSGAIAVLPLEEKRRQVIGLAVIDQQRCLPWAEGTPCIVCEEVCPVPDKAILLTGQGGGGGGSCGGSGSGNRTGLPRPKMIGDRCIGCGICETKCPVEGTSAIVVRRRPDGYPTTVA
jgi:ferredoxin